MNLDRFLRLATDWLGVKLHLQPDRDNALDLGAAAARWRNIYVEGFKRSTAANTVLRGPASGAAADPVFGALVAADMPAGVRFVPLTTLLASTSWDGEAKAADSSGTLDVVSVFDVPAGAKAVSVSFEIVDETPNVTAALGPNSTNISVVVVATQVANIYSRNSGIVPMDGNNIYFYTTGELDGVYLVINGYWI